MDKGLLDQTCQITVQAETAPDRFNPAKEVLNVLIDNVQCSLDTLYDARVGTQATPGMTALRGGGLLFIDGDYSSGLTRQFNEKNIILLDGFQFTIDFIHDIHDGSGLDHYEVELIRRVVGGV
jgi:hypothetical protein